MVIMTSLLPTLSQVVAMTIVYRRLVSVGMILPILMITVVPIIWWIICFMVLNLLSASTSSTGGGSSSSSSSSSSTMMSPIIMILVLLLLALLLYRNSRSTTTTTTIITTASPSSFLTQESKTATIANTTQPAQPLHQSSNPSSFTGIIAFLIISLVTLLTMFGFMMMMTTTTTITNSSSGWVDSPIPRSWFIVKTNLLEPMLSWRTIPIHWFISIAGIMVCLGIAVASRYVGPKSIMRCSVMPLLANPMDSSIRSLLEDPWTTLVQPGEIPGVLLTTPLQVQQQQQQQQYLHQHLLQQNNHPPSIVTVRPTTVIQYRGRRYQRWIWSAYIAQFVLTGFLSLIMSAIINYNNSSSTSIRSSSQNHYYHVWTFLVCWITTFGPLVWTIMDGIHHEINPQYYLNRMQQQQRPLDVTSILFPHIYSTMGLALIAPAIGLLLVTVRPSSSQLFILLFLGQDKTSINSSIHSSSSSYLLSLEHTIFQYLWLGFISAIMVCYSYALDELMRLALFQPIAHWNVELEYLHDHYTPAVQLDVVMQSILRDFAVVPDIWIPLTRAVATATELEVTELNRTKGLTLKLAEFLLNGTDERREAHFEEDLLQVLVLDSLGGQGSDDDATRRLFNQLSLVEPLLRCLSVFIGGVGDALRLCAMSSQHQQHQQTKSTIHLWKVPPGLLTCLKLAIHAMVRCVTNNLMGPTGRPMSDWRAAPLSPLVPAAIQSIYSLRNGVTNFVIKGGMTTTTTTTATMTPVDMMKVHDPELVQILQVCDEAMRMIHPFVQLPHMPNALDISVDRDCLVWIKNIQYSIHQEDPHYRKS